MASLPVTEPHQTSGSRDPDMVLEVNLPEGMDPAIAESIKPKIEQALVFLMLAEQPAVIEQADRIAELLFGKIQPNTELVEARLARLRTVRTVLEEGEWLTAEQLNALQPKPPAQKSQPASAWKRRGRIFGVNYSGREYFARYQFDEAYQPLPVIKDILRAFGTVADNWKIATWFHFPNGWLMKPGTDEQQPVAPKDTLDQRTEVLSAASNRHGSYVA